MRNRERNFLIYGLEMKGLIEWGYQVFVLGMRGLIEKGIIYAF